MLTLHTTADITRELALRLARRIAHGRLVVIDGGRFVFGDPEASLRATLRVSRSRFYRRLLLSGDLGVGEAYADGDFECDDITALATIALRNRAFVDMPIARAPKRLHGLLAEILAASMDRQRRWVAAHYDLGNDFFASFLDDTMAYSCALFEPANSLTEATLAKQALVCKKLALEPGDHLLDLGGGWGALAFFAARNVGCRVTTVTLSKAQHEFVRARIQELDLGELVRALWTDYRELSGSYDKVASIEMLEAVGHAQHEKYFEVCHRLLRPRGRLLVQCITVPDDRYASARRNAEFMKRHVFPGGCLPSEERIGDVAAPHFELVDRCDLTAHYVPTLRAWRERFVMQRQELRARGYTERLLRTWEWYLGICEASFAERHTGDVQLSFARR